MTEMLDTFLPRFGGFHRSRWGQMLSDFDPLFSTMHAASERRDGGLDERNFRSILSEVGDTERLREVLARSFCLHFDDRVSQTVSFRVGLKFLRLKSPTYRDSATDRILAVIPSSSVGKLFDVSARRRQSRPYEAVRDPPTAHPGFVPNYHLGIVDRIALPLAEWDEHGICGLLDSFVDPAIDEAVRRDIAGREACSAFESSVDWKRFDEKADALRRARTEKSQLQRRAS